MNTSVTHLEKGNDKPLAYCCQKHCIDISISDIRNQAQFQEVFILLCNTHIRLTYICHSRHLAAHQNKSNPDTYQLDFELKLVGSKNAAAKLGQMDQFGVRSVQYSPVQGDMMSGSNRSTEKAREMDRNCPFKPLVLPTGKVSFRITQNEVAVLSFMSRQQIISYLLVGHFIQP